MSVFDGFTVEQLRNQLDMVAYVRNKLGGIPRRVAPDEVRIVGVGIGGFQINVKKRVWYHFAGETGGDAIDLVGWCEHGAQWDRNNIQLFKAACESAARFIESGITTSDRHDSYEYEPRLNDRGRLVATYSYSDEHGKKAFVKERWEHHHEGKHSKSFVVKQPDGTPGLGKVSPVLYHLPQVRIAINLPDLRGEPDSPIIIVEGEKCADLLSDHGFVTTTTPFGAGDWEERYTDSMKGAEYVVLIPDNDTEGRKHMEKIAEALRPHVNVLKIVELPGLRHKQDIVDWFAQKHTPDELQMLFEKTPQWKEPQSSSRLKTIDASELMKKNFAPMKMIISDILPEGVALLAGRPKVGKSWLALQIAVSIVNQQPLLGKHPTTTGDALYCGLEDSHRRLRSRLASMGFQEGQGKLHLLTELPRLDDGCLDELADWLDQHQNTRLVVIDTLAKIIPPNRKSNDAYHVDYDLIAKLQRLALSRGISILLVHHTRKQEAGYAVDEVHGSTGLTGGADTILILRTTKKGSATLTITGRDVGDDDILVAFNKQTFRWEEFAHSITPSLSPERQEIIDLLDKVDGSLTPTEIAERLGKKREAVQRLCSKLREDGTLKKTSDGRYHRT